MQCISILGRSVFSVALSLALVTEGVAGDQISLTTADRKAIVVAVAHAITRPAGPFPPPVVTISLTIDGDSTGELTRYVISTYPSRQRFTSEANRIKRGTCFYEKTTNRPSLGIGIGKIDVVDRSTVKVQAGSALCIMGSSGDTYRLRKKNGKWSVISSSQDYII